MANYNSPNIYETVLQRTVWETYDEELVTLTILPPPQQT